MHKARHHPLAHTALRAYLKVAFRRSFHEIYLGSQPPFPQHIVPPDSPLILVPNHASWWDGFFSYLLAERVFNRRMYILMLEEELARRPFFRAVGGCSINPRSPKGILESLRYLTHLLDAAPNCMITYFPEGALLPDVDRPYLLREGLTRLTPKTPPVLIPCYFRLEQLAHQRPTTFIRLGAPLEFPRYQSDPVLLTAALTALRHECHQAILSDSRWSPLLRDTPYQPPAPIGGIP
jgi:1-acyl-sn-glycerol-3-phosphate acyltransferase